MKKMSRWQWRAIWWSVCALGGLAVLLGAYFAMRALGAPSYVVAVVTWVVGAWYGKLCGAPLATAEILRFGLGDKK